MSPSASPPPGPARGGRSSARPAKRRFPWLLLLLLLGSVYGFWVHPLRHPAPPVKIEYAP